MTGTNRADRAAGIDTVEFSLEGGGDLGDVPAEDVGTFIVEVVRVVARAAGHALGRPVKDTGRHEALVKAASQVRLASIRSGSVIVEIRPSKSAEFTLADENLGLDAKDVSRRALEIARQALRDEDAYKYPDVAGIWVGIADRLAIGERYERIVVAESGQPPAALDRRAAERLRSIAERAVPAEGRNIVRGVLFAADFEKLTAKLRLPNRSLVDVTFDLDHADDIKHALRNLTTVAGHATFDRRSNRLVSIRLEDIEQPVQLQLGGEFWVDKSAGQLLSEQAVVAVEDPAWFQIPDVSEEEWDRFFEAVLHG